MARILKANLEIALQIAIETRERHEKEVLKYTGESCLVAGWREILKASQNGEHIEVKP